MTTVFISYRRNDASANAGRLCDWLKRQFGADKVFLDTEKIAPGDTFPVVLEQRLAASDVLLAIIGPRWARKRNGVGLSSALSCRPAALKLSSGNALRTALSDVPRDIDLTRPHYAAMSVVPRDTET